MPHLLPKCPFLWRAGVTEFGMCRALDCPGLGTSSMFYSRVLPASELGLATLLRGVISVAVKQISSTQSVEPNCHSMYYWFNECKEPHLKLHMNMLCDAKYYPPGRPRHRLLWGRDRPTWAAPRTTLRERNSERRGRSQNINPVETAAQRACLWSRKEANCLRGMFSINSKIRPRDSASMLRKEKSGLRHSRYLPNRLQDFRETRPLGLTCDLGCLHASTAR